VLQIIFDLLLAATVGLADRALHRPGHAVGIEDDPAINIAGGAADGLDQRGFAAQETFLVGVEYRHQTAFGNIQPLAQQIDAYQHVIDAQPEIADQLDPFQRLDIAVHVADLDPRLVHEFGQVLRHPLGQRGDQSAIALRRNLAAFVDHVIDLILDRFDLDRWIDQPRRADHLFAEHAAGLFHFPGTRRRRDADRLRPHRVPFIEAQRPVVDTTGQPETIFGQRDLAAMIALGHGADLRNGLVAFVHEQERIVGQIFKQGGRRLARQSPGQEAGIIFDSRAAAGGGNHLEIKIGPLFQPLMFDQLAFGLQFLEPLRQLEPDCLGRLFHRRPRRHIMRIGKDPHPVEAHALLAGQRIEFDNLLDLVAEETDPPGHVLIMGGEYLEIVAPHPEIAAREGLIIALILQRHQLADDIPLIDRLFLLQIEDHRRIGLDRADAVETGHRCHDDHVIALEQRTGRAVAHPVDRLVYRAFLLDIGVRPRDIGFGLVIVIIRHEIFDRIVREEILELAVKLRRQDLVGGQDQRRPLQLVDDLGHGEGLARPGYAEQHLIALILAHPLDQLPDRIGLVTSGFEIADQLEPLSAFRLFRTAGLVRDEILAGVRLRQTSSDYQFCHGIDMEQKGSNVIPGMELSADCRDRKFTMAAHRFMVAGGASQFGEFSSENITGFSGRTRSDSRLFGQGRGS